MTFWGHTEIDPRPCPVYDWRALLGLGNGRRLGAVPFADPATLANEAAVAAAWPTLTIVDPPAPPIGARLLFEGCHGPDVSSLQVKLGAAYTGQLGRFDRATYDAVVAFQKAHSLDPVDGIVGKDTRAALGL